jgi:hypothetical protein
MAPSPSKVSEELDPVENVGETNAWPTPDDFAGQDESDIPSQR